ILDISDPTKPTLVRKHSEDFVIDDLFLMDNLIYMVGQGKPVEVSPNVFESKNNIRVLDISNRTNPVLVGKYKKQMSLPRDIYIYNGIAYVVHLLPKDTLKILDASDLTNLTLLGNYEFEIDNIRMVKGVYVFDKYAYVISNKKLLILDISDPTKPILIKTVDQNSLYTISGIENYIYLISFSPEGVPQFQIFEIR
ncbi:MAG: LVIVD repeat-containing protein, partial [Methanosarcinales archaeon]